MTKYYTQTNYNPGAIINASSTSINNVAVAYSYGSGIAEKTVDSEKQHKEEEINFYKDKKIFRK